MCVGGTPDVPAVPERQSAKAPDKSSVGGTTSGDAARRRMQFASSILTSSQGAMGAPNTTAAMKSVTGV